MEKGINSTKDRAMEDILYRITNRISLYKKTLAKEQSKASTESKRAYIMGKLEGYVDVLGFIKAITD